MGAHDVLMQPCDASSALLSWTGRDEAGASRLKDSITGPGPFHELPIPGGRSARIEEKVHARNTQKIVINIKIIVSSL